MGDETPAQNSTPLVIVGHRTIAALTEQLTELNSTGVLVVCSPRRRFVRRVVGLIERFERTVFDGARVHVPRGTVELASAALDRSGADTVVTLGGGSATGLGKALRLERSPHFVAVATTYSGSEMTSIYGITEGRKKRTGRDPRVRPDAVIYDTELFETLPLSVEVQSLFNALAHPLSALTTDALDAEQTRRAIDAASSALATVRELVEAGPSPALRERAVHGAIAAASIIEGCSLGVHHRIAHALGGRFALPHAELHALLLPHSLAQFRRSDPAGYQRIAAALGAEDLPETLSALLDRVGAPTSLASLGVTREALEQLLAERPDLPRSSLLGAHAG